MFSHLFLPGLWVVVHRCTVEPQFTRGRSVRRKQVLMKLFVQPLQSRFQNFGCFLHHAQPLIVTNMQSCHDNIKAAMLSDKSLFPVASQFPSIHLDCAIDDHLLMRDEVVSIYRFTCDHHWINIVLCPATVTLTYTMCLSVLTVLNAHVAFFNSTTIIS